jgi:hypothetical protein
MNVVSASPRFPFANRIAPFTHPGILIQDAAKSKQPEENQPFGSSKI